MEEIANPINEDLTYEDIIQKLNEAKEAGTPIDEGIFGALIGGVTGLTMGTKIGNAICKALGIDPKGTLGSLITSKLVMGSVLGTLGYKI